jgi:hypothetical protein
LGPRSGGRAPLSGTIRIRVAITNTRIVALDDHTVTIRLQRAQIIALAHLPHAWPRVRSPFSPALSAQRLAGAGLVVARGAVDEQNALLQPGIVMRFWAASMAARATSQSRAISYSGSMKPGPASRVRGDLREWE